MKKEINNLLATDGGKLKINRMFTLNRWLKNSMGYEIDGLELEMTGPYHKCMEIKSRTFSEIQKEIEIKMAMLMNELTEEMVKKVKGGLI